MINYYGLESEVKQYLNKLDTVNHTFFLFVIYNNGLKDYEEIQLYAIFDWQGINIKWVDYYHTKICVSYSTLKFISGRSLVIF